MVYDENDAAIADAARSLLLDAPPIGQIRATDRMTLLPDAATWSGYAEQGWFGLSLPEESGGVGLGLSEHTILLLEAGRLLAPGPLVATITAAHLAAQAGQAERVTALLEGATRAAFVLSDGEPGSTTTGEVVAVGDGLGADLVVAFDGPDVLLFEAGSLAEAKPVLALDPGSRLVHGRLDGGAAVATVSGPEAVWLRATAEVLSAAVLCGIAQAVVDMSVEYAKVRTQFGKPIGTFQAVSHRCAWMAARAEAARCQTLFTGLSMDAAADDEGVADAVLSARSSLAIAVGSARENCADNMRNHAAIGMTYEHDAHLYLLRSQAVTASMGSQHTRLRALAEAPTASLAGIS
jgi:alkylation response protein AidB-like acyl-CoA dehydrogenase